MPEIKPQKVGKQLEVPQPRNAPFHKLPMNQIYLAPSGQGKTVAALSTLMDRDKLGGLFDRYYVFAVNVFTDPQYRPFMRYVENQTGQKPEDCMFDKWDPKKIMDILAEMRKANA